MIVILFTLKESYCEVLHRYKEELSKPFYEATTFLNNIESQLSNLCKGALTKTLDYRSAGKVSNFYFLALIFNEYEAVSLIITSISCYCTCKKNSTSFFFIHLSAD